MLRAPTNDACRPNSPAVVGTILQDRQPALKRRDYCPGLKDVGHVCVGRDIDRSRLLLHAKLGYRSSMESGVER
jgi:hypothetical protein